ncbi:MAG: divergent polysaccharide deacetylase family protein [Spirochaetia bacterium]|nr:divergent polysaccharide deacetylase family protein [Spirochaetia bacterium]
MARKRKRASAAGRATAFAASSGTLVMAAFALALALTRPETGSATSSDSGPALPPTASPAAPPRELAAPIAPIAPLPAAPGGHEPGPYPAAEGASGAVAERLPARAVRPAEPAKPPKGGAKLVIVIDDVGHNLHQLEPFLRLPFPVTFSVLPNLPYTAEAARLIRAAGKELMLHQPMEALGDLDEGPGAVYRYMEGPEVAATLLANLAQVPGAVAINNHMGSAATGDGELMRAVAETASGAGVWFLDSLTNGDSVVQSVSLELGIPHLERDVFLDNKPDRASMVEAVEDGARRAARDGRAVMIGHVWSAELADTLMQLYPELVERGFSLSTISRIMMDELDADTGD